MEDISIFAIIVNSNTVISEFSLEGVRQHCPRRRTLLRKSLAIVTRKHQPLPYSVQHRLYVLRDDRTGNLPVVLKIAHGNPVQCTKNVRSDLKLANGSVGKVCAIAVADEDIVTELDDSIPSVSINVQSMLSATVFIKLSRRENICLRAHFQVMSGHSDRLGLLSGFLTDSYHYCGADSARSAVRHHCLPIPGADEGYQEIGSAKGLEQANSETNQLVRRSHAGGDDASDLLDGKLKLEELKYFHPLDSAVAGTARLHTLDGE